MQNFYSTKEYKHITIAKLCILVQKWTSLLVTSTIKLSGWEEQLVRDRPRVSLSKKYGGVCPVVHSVNIRRAYTLCYWNHWLMFRLYSLQHANASGLVRNALWKVCYYLVYNWILVWWGTRTDRRNVDRLLTRWTAMDGNAVGSICLAYRKSNSGRLSSVVIMMMTGLCWW